MCVAASQTPAWPQPHTNNGTHHASARSCACPRQEAGQLQPTSPPVPISQIPKSLGGGGVCLLPMLANGQSSSSGVPRAATFPSRKSLVKHCAKAQDSSHDQLLQPSFVFLRNSPSLRSVCSFLSLVLRSHLPTTAPLVCQGQVPISTAILYK